MVIAMESIFSTIGLVAILYMVVTLAIKRIEYRKDLKKRLRDIENKVEVILDKVEEI